MGNAMTQSKRASRAVPSWVPADVRNYVFHTEMGQAIRVLARSQSCHASTIMRQVRKVEQRRDDPLVDRAIRALSDVRGDDNGPSPLVLLQALRRMAMPDALLAIAIGMDKGVIVQDGGEQDPDHGSTLPIQTAMSLALRGWISCKHSASRVQRYRITPAGRIALRELTAQSENEARAMAEGPVGFDGAPKGVGTCARDTNLRRSAAMRMGNQRRIGEPFWRRLKIITRSWNHPVIRLAQLFGRSSFLGLVCLKLRCAVAVCWKVWKSLKNTWAGLRDLARLCCGSRCNAWYFTMKRRGILGRGLAEARYAQRATPFHTCLRPLDKPLFSP